MYNKHEQGKTDIPRSDRSYIGKIKNPSLDAWTWAIQILLKGITHTGETEGIVAETWYFSVMFISWVHNVWILLNFIFRKKCQNDPPYSKIPPRQQKRHHFTCYRGSRWSDLGAMIRRLSSLKTLYADYFPIKNYSPIILPSLTTMGALAGLFLFALWILFIPLLFLFSLPSFSSFMKIHLHLFLSISVSPVHFCSSFILLSPH